MNFKMLMYEFIVFVLGGFTGLVIRYLSEDITIKLNGKFNYMMNLIMSSVILCILTFGLIYVKSLKQIIFNFKLVSNSIKNNEINTL